MLLNGTQHIISEEEKNMDLKTFLYAQGFDMSRVAVELNGKVIPRALLSETLVSELAQGDILEVVSFVGGG